MRQLLWLILLLLGVTGGGWMLFDGIRRLATGDYVRIHGQIGPWQHIFSAIRINPMGTPVAALFVICGAARLIATVGVATQSRWGWEATLLTAIASAWLLPFGTANSLLTVILLFIPTTRAIFGV